VEVGIQSRRLSHSLPWAPSFPSEKNWMPSMQDSEKTERLIPTSTHFQPPRQHQEKHELHQNRPLACLPSRSGLAPETNGRSRLLDSIMVPFEWLVMPEGLTNALAAFNCLMNNIFADMIDVIVIIYFDNDFCIYSANISKHKVMLRKYFRGSVPRTVACADKCEFHITSCNTSENRVLGGFWTVASARRCANLLAAVRVFL